jgi:cephalosporin-C deacetylase-like acetyl esterase
MRTCSSKQRSDILLRVATLFCLVLASVFGQDYLERDLKHFHYDQHAPLDMMEGSVQDLSQVTVHDVTYASPRGGRVPAYLVLPKGTGKFAAILWGHWMMPGSPTANRKEFLDEAIAIAPSGVVSLLIDAPYVRPGFRLDPNPLGPQQAEVLAQQVVDLRRGVDLLLARREVDPKRIAYVGHSFDAGTGPVLDAIDKRLAAFVFMGGPQSIRQSVLTSTAPDLVAFRKSVPLPKLRKYLDTYAWADPATYAGHLGPAAALFQYATHDDYVSVADARYYYEMSSGPKELNFYNSSHALNPVARHDRFDFLREHLALSDLPPGTLEKVPPTK